MQAQLSLCLLASLLSGCVAPKAVPLRILAYNIRHGAGMDRRVDLERTARVINSLKPDLVALQEVDMGTKRTQRVMQARRLGELTGMEWVFGRFIDYQGGEYGLALLSRYPILESQNHLVPKGKEARSALAARVRIGEGGPEVVLVGIHLYRTDEERLSQAEKIIQIFSSEKAPVVLAGDFNSLPGSEVMQALGRHWHVTEKRGDRFTFPSVEPVKEIDFILIRPKDRFEILDSKVVDEALASDHRPILLEVKLRPDRAGF